MYHLALNNFRGFQNVPAVAIKPLTFLIGENSAGKSSFLAALKFMLDFGAGRGASFNKDPFQLGTFQQIAHFRGGKAGRAKKFSLQTCVDVLRDSSENSDTTRVSLELIFDSLESHAAIVSAELKAEGDSLRLSLSSGRLVVELTLKGKETHRISTTGLFSRMSRTDVTKYWPFILENLATTINRQGNQAFDSTISEDIFHRVTEFEIFFQKISLEMSGPAEATSAIRTKPLRTYTPGSDLKDGEGSHVPFEMAKLYRSSKEGWNNLKNSLERYGHKSDMFKEVNIKSFGQTASDPFQLQFSSDGPKMNIVDLGYGTSQVLPILFDVTMSSSKSHFLIQQPEVHLHPKAQAALGSFFVDALVASNKRFVLETHSDFIVDRARQAVASGRISQDDVSILFFERKRLEDTVTEIALDSQGDPIDTPLSYRTFFLDEQLRTLGAI